METYFERCKKVGRLGPMRTELDRSSVYGDAIYDKDRVSNSAYNNSSSSFLLEMDGSEPLNLDVEAKS